MTFPKRYLLLVCATGASIGGIAGLSASPVGQTVLELVAVFVAGAGSAYLLMDTKLSRRTAFLNALGSVGLAFLASFWVALVVLSSYRMFGDPTAPIRDLFAISDEEKRAANVRDRNLAEFAIFAEVNSHLRALGVLDSERSKVIDDMLMLASVPEGGTQCDIGAMEIHTFEIQLRIAKDVVNAVLQCGDPSLAIEDKNAAAQIKFSFDKMYEAMSRVRQGTDIPARFQMFYTAFLIDFEPLLQKHPKALRDAPEACFGSDLRLQAGTLAGPFANCSISALQKVLLEVRGHAATFATIWGAPSYLHSATSTTKGEVRRPGVLENN